MKKIVEELNQNLDKLITPDGNMKIGFEYPYEVGDMGAQMELLPEGGFYIKLVTNDINEEDINEFRYGDIGFKVLFNEDKVYMLIRFGKGSLLYEILFNPTLYPNKEATKESIENSNLVYAIFIDGNSKKVQGIKVFNFPLETYEKLKTAWTKALVNKNYTEEFQAYCTGFFSQDIGYWWDNIL